MRYEVPEFSPLHVGDHSLIDAILSLAHLGTGAYRPGEVYWQAVASRVRPVLLTQRNEDGSVEGWYLGAGMPAEHGLGIPLATLLPAIWTRPSEELFVRDDVDDSQLRRFMDYAFPVSREPREDEAPTLSHREPLAVATRRNR